MISVFLDASVIIAGVYAETGASSLILKLSQEKKIKAYVTRLIVQEVIRNVKKKFPSDAVGKSLSMVAASNVIKISLAKETEITRLKHITHEKDIHVLAGAYKAKVDYLITLDKKHLLSLKNKQFPFLLVSPGEFLAKFVRSRA